MIFRVEALRKSFGGLLAVNGVNLALEKGELRAIIGPNGAGKTTLFNLITGYLRPDSGRVFLNGEDITFRPPHYIASRGLSRSFQRTNIFRKMTTFENVQVAILSHQRKSLNLLYPANKLVREETLDILQRVGLSDYAGWISSTLSHGDQRRLELAITLAGKPELLALDEPTSGMVSKERLEIMELIRKIAREQGLTVLFIEHDMDVVFSISDKITVMHYGSVIAQGTPDEVRQNEEVRKAYLGEER